MAQQAVFIGYRREDTADVAGRIYDAFVLRFGKERIFKDVDNIPPGADFGDYIKTVLPKCRVFLALMGPSWLDARDEAGARRIDNPNDWVRVEIETALATPKLEVVPVLVNGARMPKPEELPESMRPLLRRNAAVIRRDPDFHDDVSKLAAALQNSIKTGVFDLNARARSRAPMPASLGLLVGLLAVAAFAGGGYYASQHWFGRANGTLTSQPGAAETPATTAPGVNGASPAATKTGTATTNAAGAPAAAPPQTPGPLPAGFEPETVSLPGGAYWMGSPPTDPDAGEVEWRHQVTVAPFFMGKYEVTVAQYGAFVEATNRADPEIGENTPCTWQATGGKQTPDSPVVCVSVQDAEDYAAWLSRKTGKHYYLPTEEEWEYAARGGTTTRFWWGDDVRPGYANCEGCGPGQYRDRAAPVNAFPANPFGIYGTAGNASEITASCLRYNLGDTPDCRARFARGGSMVNPPSTVRSAYKDRFAVEGRNSVTGFRVARKP